MADNNRQDEPKPRVGLFRRLANAVRNNSDELYKSTYYSDNNNKKQLDMIRTDITTSIKDIMDGTADVVGEPNISKLFERLLMNTQNDSKTVSEFERIFGDNDFVNNLTNSYLDNRWVKAVDDEIDQVIKYMPKLKEALSVMRDNVLSSDSFSKDFLNISSNLQVTEVSDNQFARNIEDMKERYDLIRKISKIYDDESTYGEQFIYCVPYTKAIQRLVDRKHTNIGVTVRANYHENSVVMESVDGRFESETISMPEKFELGKDDNFKINVTFENGIIGSIVEAEQIGRTQKKKLKEQSLTEQYFKEMGIVHSEATVDVANHGQAYTLTRMANTDSELGAKLPTHYNFDYTIDDDMKLPNGEDTTADGLYTKPSASNKIKDMNGAIVKVLKHDRVLPIIMNDDICLGYYYFEYDTNQAMFEERYSTTGMVNTITGLRSNGRAEAFDSMARREELLRNIANQLAEKITPSFINSNQDLKKEIYHILKYSDDFNAAAGSEGNIRVSYIPPEDIQHLYFELDEDTGRGISDLNNALIQAKLWVAIYITNCLAVMTRGNDKRVYYVKQTVETNISKTLLKTINEIKKSNFGIRQIENINSVLNITGRFNDYIIPRGADGQSPIEFEVMPGQNVEIKTDLLNLLEESAINSTGVPLEIIQSRQSPDYAMQLTMSNSKFLRFVYFRQAQFQKQLNQLFTKIYDIEYNTNDQINVTLPPPLFINVTNTNQLITNTNDFCNNIVEIYMADEQDDVLKQKFAMELKKHYLGNYLNSDMITDIMNRARQNQTKSIVGDANNLESDGGEQ
jgi:hypothetical protein